MNLRCIIKRLNQEKIKNGKSDKRVNFLKYLFELFNKNKVKICNQIFITNQIFRFYSQKNGGDLGYLDIKLCRLHK